MFSTFFNCFRSVESLPLASSPQPSSKRTSECSSLTDSQTAAGSSIDRRHQAATMERQRGGNTPTPTGTLKKRRNGSLDSPSMHRNPLRKLSGEATRSSSPELPAVHFFNSKMQQPRGSAAQVQNAMFDNLKSPTSPVSPKSTVSEGAVRAIASPTMTHSQIAAVQPLRKTLSEPNCKPPPAPAGYNTHFRNGHQSPVYRCISPTLKSQLQKVAEDEALEEAVCSEPLNTKPILEVPQPLVEIPQANCVSVGEKVRKMVQDNHYAHLTDCTSRSLALTTLPVTDISHSNSEDKFVTGIYREPIDRCHSTTPSCASSDRTFIIKDDMSDNAQSDIQPKPSPKVSHRTQTQQSPNIKLRNCTKSKPNSRQNSTSSSVSPITPTPGSISLIPAIVKPSEEEIITPTNGFTTSAGLVANINGKTMSLLADKESGESKASTGGASNNFSKTNNSLRNGLMKMASADSKAKYSRDFRKSYPCAPPLKPKTPKYLSPPRQRKEFNSGFVSDDEKDSVCSRPYSSYSEHSSIVFLNPVELKSSRNALIKQIPYQQGRQNVLSYVFTSPYSTLDKFKSRSSDTINSIPGCPPTPKFPVPEPSLSLTDLLNEMTTENTYDFKECSRRELDCLNGPVGIPPQSPQSRARVRQPKAQDSSENPSSANLSPSSNRKSPSQRISMNPFQIKRRQHHSMPPRHCRSLDYIPSDLEDNVGSPPNSPPCGSPKEKKHNAFWDGNLAEDRHAYLMPLIFGEQPSLLSRAEHTSLSSLASSSAMSQSDPQLNGDSGSAAYESEYDNYPPGGITSDDDYLVPDSDLDLDMFDDVNVDNVTVSDSFSLDMPVPRFQKRVTSQV